MLFDVNFTELAEGQCFIALAWGITALLVADDPRARAKEQAVHQGQTRIKRGLCLALVSALELLSAADLSGLFVWPKFKIKIL